MSKKTVLENALKAQKKLDKIDAKLEAAIERSKAKAHAARKEVFSELSPEVKEQLESVAVA